MRDTNDEPQGGGEQHPEITIVGLANESYYLVEGVEHIDQILLVDGNFPKPILCLHFESMNHVRSLMGDVDMSQYWAIHVEIVARLRDASVLVEKAVPNRQ
jgi:hypothetical protein